MEWMDRTFGIMADQGKTAGQACRVAGDYTASVVEYSTTFLRACAERQAALGLGLMNAKTFEAAAQMHGDFMREAMRANSEFAARLADAMGAAGKEAQHAQKSPS